MDSSVVADDRPALRMKGEHGALVVQSNVILIPIRDQNDLFIIIFAEQVLGQVFFLN